jgi:O-antigen/teichoic acid export membrane protein
LAQILKTFVYLKGGMNNSNKTIAKNTLFLYLRQLVTMAVSLFSTGIVMRELGVQDYGIYNVVGGLVVLFSILQSAMAVGTQRFLNFEMGKGNTENVRDVFCISLIIYIAIAALVLVLCETVGLWYLNTKMDIPADRTFAAHCVFQASIITCILSITQTPYMAVIIANEKMGTYGYLGIGESIIRFLLILLLLVVPCDKLIFYAIINLSVGVLFRILYMIYCRRTFPECTFRIPKNKALYKDILSFSGWSLFARIAYVGRDQGGAIIVNKFFGVILNASMAVAMNVNSSVSSFVNNFQTAYRPQLVKSYAAGDYPRLVQLFFTSSKMSVFLMSLLSVPVIINIEYILSLWLGNVPDKSGLLISILMVDSFISAMFAPFWMTIFAMGNIRKYQIMEGALILLNVPLMYIAFKAGLAIEWMYIIRIIVMVTLFMYAIHYMRNKIDFPLRRYIMEIISPSIIVLCLPYAIVYLCGQYFAGFEKLVITTILFVALYLPSYFFIALSSTEKVNILSYIKNYKKRLFL